MYVSGADNRSPLFATAITEKAFDSLLAVNFVPSKGSGNIKLRSI